MFLAFIGIGVWLSISYCQERVAEGKQSLLHWLINGKREESESDLHF